MIRAQRTKEESRASKSHQKMSAVEYYAQETFEKEKEKNPLDFYGFDDHARKCQEDWKVMYFGLSDFREPFCPFRSLDTDGICRIFRLKRRISTCNWPEKPKEKINHAHYRDQAWAILLEPENGSDPPKIQMRPSEICEFSTHFIILSISACVCYTDFRRTSITVIGVAVLHKRCRRRPTCRIHTVAKEWLWKSASRVCWQGNIFSVVSGPSIMTGCVKMEKKHVYIEKNNF